MKTVLNGILLAFQFFTVVPINKELPLTKKTITAMFSFLPWLGAIMGAVMTAIFYLLQTYTDLSSILTGFLLVFGYVIWTGGLHLDGFVDMGDAYFSYRDIDKRIEILDDPRIGAFGAMSLVFLVLTKIFFLSELVGQQDFNWIWLIAVPFYSRLGMSVYFIQTKSSKEKGLGFFFKQHLNLKYWLISTIISTIIGTTFLFWLSGQWQLIILLLIVIVTAFFYKWWTIRNFRGSSGDLLGAFIEGMEGVLWIALLLFT
ncbi:adenosylcobinamide-GDP ribazoletransferase [Rummeliibacillus sp. TYF005]|uniref:adenosylcobinamide-GDP ribazoletransferase n=1 Tax=unclassified Rummeliibacillus TaxID=2622809 RepID=UPI000E662B9A|nr:MULTISPECIES: adenosylcobinamide-GDP ribazoletransferase [unclassified Rummeliibacillus]RIJ69468.1 adenosylcobinamide-GDP ribazoletransferase [Rummeliibacillus sp. POC4]RPJ96434.1 adenosylcobinamide-GDP ribazoletransferase [Rummeliibacillus sp. TYF005]